MIKKLFSLAAAVLVCAGVWAADVTWDFSNLTAQSFTSNKSYSFMATDGTTEMRYSAGSSDEIIAKSENTSGYLKENGKTGSATVKDIDETTNVGKTRLIRLFVTGEGKLTINCNGTNGVYKVLNGSASGTTLIASLSANTQSAEITATTSPIWIETTTKGYITSIVWSPAGAPVCPSNLTISGKKVYTVGEKIELTAALEEGNGAITYQWYKGSVAEENKIAGATTTKLEIANCTGSNAGDYFCVASKADCGDAASAAYAVTVKAIEPTGDATITYALSGSTVTGTATGVNSISGLSTELTLNTLTLSGTKEGYSGAIKGCDASLEVNEDIYADLQFTVAEGYAFTPSAVSVKANPLGATGALKAVVKVMDATTTAASNELSCAKNTDNEAVFADGAFTGKLFEGTVHIRMYFYGAAADKAFYLKSPITVAGTVAVAPTKYNVTFDANGGTGEMATLKYVEGAEVTLPACTFTAPTDKEFDAWTSEDVTISNNKFTMPAKNVTITATWKNAITRYTVVYKDGEAVLGTEEVEEGNAPAQYATAQTKVSLATFVGWYDNDELTGDALDLSAATITEDTTFYAKFTYKHATSVNIEQLILDNSKSYNIKTGVLNGNNGYASNYGTGDISNDSLNTNSDRNYPYHGLKVKASGAMLNFRLAKGSVLKIKIGAIKSAKPQLSINGGNYAVMSFDTLYADQAKAVKYFVYSRTAEAEELISIKTTSTDAVVFKQIMFDEDLEEVILPALYTVTYNAGAGTCEVNKAETQFSGDVVILPAATREGYTFDGWFDAAEEGELIGIAGDKYTPAADITLFAHYTEEQEEQGCDWSALSWIGDGSPEQQYSNQFKVCVGDPAPQIVNIQKPGFASETGIYMTFPSAVFTSFSLDATMYDLQGAGIIFHLSAFTHKETEVVVVCDGQNYVFTVYNDKGIATAIDNTEAAVKAQKVLRDGQLYIIYNGKTYNVQGAAVK